MESSGRSETVEQYEQKYVDEEGTTVTKSITIQRIPPPASVGVPPVQPHEVIPLTELSIFDLACLKRHNQLRALHHSPPLKMSRKLCQYAQNWADRLAHINLIQHRPDPKRYGENLFWKTSPFMKCGGEEGPNSWYEEIADYDPSWYGGDPPADSFKVSGHFTQLIWKATEYLGVGLAIHGNSFFVVCNYWPNGNFFTTYGKNVLPPKN